MNGARRLSLRFTTVIAFQFEDDCPGNFKLRVALPRLKRQMGFPTSESGEFDLAQPVANVAKPSTLRTAEFRRLGTVDSPTDCGCPMGVAAYCLRVAITAVIVVMSSTSCTSGDSRFTVINETDEPIARATIVVCGQTIEMREIPVAGRVSGT